jgi:hypothetical protein
MEKFNGLSKEQKLELFVGVYNLMVRYQRMDGWVVYLNDHFLFFDSKPSFEDCFEVSTDDLIGWVEALK